MSERIELDGREAVEIARSEREGVRIYQSGESVLLTTDRVQAGEADAIHLSYDELMNLLVDARPHFREEADD